jgi:hypothetical protein
MPGIGVSELGLRWQPLASGFVAKWIGGWYLGLHGGIHPYYVMIALFVTILSVGEAFYSPRVYEYAAGGNFPAKLRFRHARLDRKDDTAFNAKIADKGIEA